MTTMETLTFEALAWLEANRQPKKVYRVHPYPAFGIVIVEVKRGQYWYVSQTFVPACDNPPSPITRQP